MRLSLLSFLTFGCSTTPTDTGLADVPFCESLADADTTRMEDGSDAASGSGSLSLRVITDQSDDPFDPFYVAYRAYSLEPADVGGVQTTGTTTGDGLVEKTLGVGPWKFEASWSRGSTTCTAVMEEVTIEDGRLTNACVVLTCPEE